MKSSFKFILIAVAGVAFAFTSCQKSAMKPAASADDSSAAKTIAVSKLIGGNLYKALTGRYGGANIGDGVKAPNGVVTAPKGLRINSLEAYCGLTIDTTLNFTYNAGDSVNTVDSKYKFIYTCSAGSLDGYVLSDSITYLSKSPRSDNKWITGQNYIVNSISSDFKTVLMRGTLGTSYNESVLNPATHAVTAYNKTNTQYVLHPLTVNVAGASPDVTAGTVDFVANIIYLENGNTVTGGFTGSITFLGHFLTRMSITYQGKTTVYSYNLATNDLDPI